MMLIICLIAFNLVISWKNVCLKPYLNPMLIPLLISASFNSLPYGTNDFLLVCLLNFFCPLMFARYFLWI